MDITSAKCFFLWCSVINGAMLLFSSSLCVFAADWIYGIHSRFFRISRDAFNVGIWSFIAFYKSLFIIFNVVPLIALYIIA